MIRINTLVVLLSLLVLSCKEKKTNTPALKDNTTTQTVKRITPPASTPTSKANQDSLEIPTQGVKYHIIAASYSKKSQATLFSKQLYKKGYPSKVLHQNGRYRVTLQSFMTKSRAIKELERLRDFNGKKDFWLLKE